MALPHWLGAFSAFFRSVLERFWSDARACRQDLFFENKNSCFFLLLDFPDLESECFDLLELGG
jgi:hypothetical protein